MRETVRSSHSEDNTCWPCDIIVQLFAWPRWVQHAFSTQCDCQNSFPGLTRGAHNHWRRHRAVVIRNGWMNFYGRHQSKRFCARLMHCDLWDHQCPGPTSVSSFTFIVLPQGEKCGVTHVCERVLNFIYVTIHFKLFSNFSTNYLMIKYTPL